MCVGKEEKMNVFLSNKQDNNKDNSNGKDDFFRRI
jgi:hypothetical protein